MCVNKEWRAFIESSPGGVTATPSSEEEFAIGGEDVDVSKRLAKRISENEKYGVKREVSWFYSNSDSIFPSFGPDTFEFVLGWNHAVVLKLGSSGGWEIEWVFAAVKDDIHGVFAPVGFKGIVMEGIAETQDWKIIKFDKSVPVSRVTTYNATSCSITAAFPRKAMSRLFLCHIDASFPIPIPAMVAWCRLQDSKTTELCVLEVEHFCTIASICPGGEELGKFGKSVWITEDDPVWDVQTLLLTRAALMGPDERPMENHTQFGLLLPPSSPPIFTGFIGWTNPAQLAGLLPHSLHTVLDLLAKSIGKWNPETEFYAMENLISPLLDNTYGMAGLHKLCITELDAFHKKYAQRELTPCESYVHGMRTIMRDPQGPYKVVFVKILTAYQTKVEIALTPEFFDGYRL